jgi:pyrimidine operon attenuation protein/uracil phosphoribosyltransferase
MRRTIRNRKQEVVDPSRPENRRFELTMQQTDRELGAHADRV